MPYLANDEPLCVLWLGNFFRPEYDDRQAVTNALTDIKQMGFNGFVLDSKQWRDFDDFFKGGEPSQYVAMQLFATAKAQEIGLGHMFLALYFNGDNLHAVGLRESPPIFGEEAVGLDGKGLRHYKYWSPRAQASMVYHVAKLLEVFRENHLRVRVPRGEAYPVITMFDPWISPSFDPEGQSRYRNWLARKYRTIAQLNAKYGSSFQSFAELSPADYWYGAELYHAGGDCPPAVSPEIGNLDDPGTDYYKFVDNQLWRDHEYGLYFQEMRRRLSALNEPLFMMPILNQWKMFFPSGRTLVWQSASRALDPWKVAPYLDSVTFNTMPADAVSDPDPYVVAAEIAISRSASIQRDFVAGLDILRFVENNVYRFVPPAEVIATTLLQGAQGLHVYGYNGLDDGGSLKKMPAGFRDNVSLGLQWFKKAAAMIRGKERTPEIALLYPRWLSILAPFSHQAAGDEKADFLGWFEYLSDLGYQVDIVHPVQICAGALRQYRICVLPWDPYYRFDPCPEMEQAMREWVRQGGVLLHGAGCQILQGLINLKVEPHPYDSIRDEVYILPCGYVFESLRNGEPLVLYNSGLPAAVSQRLGQGTIVSNGFHPGLSYVKREQPLSAGGVGISEVYQFPLVSATYLSQCINRHCKPEFTGVKGLEQARFADTVIMVNHNAYPLKITGLPDDALFMTKIDQATLLAHSAVAFQKEAGTAG